MLRYRHILSAITGLPGNPYLIQDSAQEGISNKEIRQVLHQPLALYMSLSFFYFFSINAFTNYL
jgi:hypothetical protein